MEISVKKIILASGSPRRRELLAQIGLDYEIITSNADENITEDKPELLVMKLSARKAQAVEQTMSDKDKAECIVIGADTVVYSNNKVLGKPTDKVDAFCMIKELSGSSHSVFTGVTLIENGVARSFCEETKVYVYDMTDREISDYIATGEPMDKAGAYGIQGAFAAFIRKIDGDYNNVVGLPVARLYQELKK